MSFRSIRGRRPVAVVASCLALASFSTRLFADDATRPVLPFEARLEGRDALIASGWTLSASAGNTIAVSGGKASISGLSNTYANLVHPLGIDNVRATASVQPDGSISWTPSLCVYWDPANWVQVSYRGGSFFGDMPYAAAMENGELFELFGLPDTDQSSLFTYDPKINTIRVTPQPGASSPRHFGIDVDQGTIRFLFSDDGHAWTQFRTFPRMCDAFKVPPKAVIVGKGYSDPRIGLNAELFKNDFHDRGTPVTSQIADISIVPLTAELRQATKRATFELEDKPGQAVLAKPGDPSFASVEGVFPPMKFPREVVGVLDHPDDFGITADGAIQYEGGYAYLELDGNARYGLDADQPAAKKSLYKGYLPIVQARWSHDGVSYEELVFADSANGSPDTPIQAYVRLRATNTSSAARTVKLGLRKCDRNGNPTDGGHAGAGWDVSLPADGAQEVKFKLGFGSDKPVTNTDSAEFNTKLNEVAHRWETLLNSQMTIDVPEQRIRDAYRAWLAFNFLDVDKINGQYEPRDGSSFYDAVFGISAALYCRILDEYGYHAESQRYLDSLLTLVKPDGEFIVNYGLPDSGALLIALDEHYRATRDEAWLKRVAPTMVKVADYIVRRSEASTAQQSPDSPYHGLIYERPYCDHPGPAYCFVADLNLAAGLVSAASALEAAGMAEQASHYRSAADTYRTNILRSIDRSTIEVDGQRIIPMFPQTQKTLKAAEYTAADYYTLLCGQMLEKGLIDPNGWEAKAIVDMVEQRGGLTMGMCRFAGGIDHAYTYGYWFNCLQRGDARKALLGLYGSMAYGMGRDTYCGVEVTNVRSGENMATLPHLYSGTQQLRLLRSLLLYEDGQELVLGQGIAQAWLADGQHVGVANAGTQFGTMAYTIESHVAQGTMTASITPPDKAPDTPIRLRIRHPNGKPIKAATVNGQPYTNFTGDTIRLTGLTGPTKLQLSF